MNKIITLSVVVLTLTALLVYISYRDKEVSKLAITSEEGKTNSDNHETPVPSEEVVTLDSVEIGDGESDLGVYVVLSTNYRVRIAESDNPSTIENYFEVVSYHEGYISPDKKFVALQGSKFEDSFVEVYEAGRGILHNRTWGRVVEWTEDSLLKVDACNLAGEDCTYLISSSNEKPWEFTERVLE